MLSLAYIQQRLQELEGWSIEGGNAIVKDYTFPDFKQALAFVNKVGELAEQHEHHPLILIDYTAVRLTLTTHDEHGLTERDFKLARAIDALEKAA